MGEKLQVGENYVIGRSAVQGRDHGEYVGGSRLGRGGVRLPRPLSGGCQRGEILSMEAHRWWCAQGAERIL
jgi:hypothetical protein